MPCRRRLRWGRGGWLCCCSPPRLSRLGSAAELIQVSPALSHTHATALQHSSDTHIHYRIPSVYTTLVWHSHDSNSPAIATGCVHTLDTSKRVQSPPRSLKSPLHSIQQHPSSCYHLSTPHSTALPFLSFNMSAHAPNAIDVTESVNRATDELLRQPDWGANLQLVDIVNANPHQYVSAYGTSVVHMCLRCIVV